MNIDQIKDANRKAGKHFFERATMRFFRSRILSDTYYSHSFDAYGVVFFVTSERYVSQLFNEARFYTVRAFRVATGDVDTVGDFQGYDTADQAKRIARKLADGEIPYFG